MSEGSWYPTTWREAVPLAVWGVLVFACGFEFVSSATHAELWPSIYSGVGFVVLLAMLIHGKTFIERLKALDIGWMIGVGLVLFALSIISQQQTQSAAPTSGEIASAVVNALPKQAAPSDDSAVRAERDRAVANLSAMTTERDRLTQTLAAKTAPPPFVNPFHESLVKWNVVEGIRLEIMRGNLSPSCHVIIVRLQEPYPEDFAAEFVRILDVIGWKHEERFATKTIPKDVSVLTIDYRQTPELRAQPAPGMECAEALNARFENAANTRHGNRLNAVLHWVTYDDAPDYLKQCRECLEVDFGNEDTSR